MDEIAWKKCFKTLKEKYKRFRPTKRSLKLKKPGKTIIKSFITIKFGKFYTLKFSLLNLGFTVRQ